MDNQLEIDNVDGLDIEDNWEFPYGKPESSEEKLDIAQTTPSISYPKKEDEFLNVVEICIDEAETFEDVIEGDFVIIDARPVSGDTEDALIAEIEKQLPTNLAESGTAFGNAQSQNDGELKDIQYKIRYRYERADGYPNESGGRSAQRDFCVLMMNGSRPRNRWFRMEDIDRMNDQAVNDGFGIDGAATYNIMKYKGGPNCKHIWVRYVFVKQGLEGSIDVKSPTAQRDVLDQGQAQAIGIRPKMPESPLMSIPPYAMLNRGYYLSGESRDSFSETISARARVLLQKVKRVHQRLSNELLSKTEKK